jgi:hypothetical protein
VPKGRRIYVKYVGKDGNLDLLLMLLSSVWAPLKGPVLDWPLAVCESTSVDPQDLVLATQRQARGSKDTDSENVVVRYNPQQRWYYLSNQMPSELFVFRQVDFQDRTKLGKSLPDMNEASNVEVGVPHTSFQIPGAERGYCRESVEVRAVVYFKD